MTLRREAFENIVGKGENVDNQHFLLFLKCFLPFPKQISIFLFSFILSSASSLNLNWSKTLSFGEELLQVLHNLQTVLVLYTNNVIFFFKFIIISCGKEVTHY